MPTLAAQTRREQIAELMRRHGFRGFGLPEAKALLAWLTPIAQINRKPAHLVAVLLDQLRRQRILLPRRWWPSWWCTMPVPGLSASLIGR